MSGDVNGRSKRVSFRCPLDLLAVYEAAAGDGTITEALVAGLRECATLRAEVERLRAICKQAGVPTW